MGYFAGDLKEITITHPTIGSVTLQVKASEDNTYDLGGVRTTEVMVTGNGTSMRKLNNNPWAVTATIAWDMLTQLELQTVNALAASTLEADYTFSNINGSVYGGKGSPEGELKANVNNATFPATFKGGGALKKIA